uniref:BED-type domain-containing protein n=1 Tax=Ascaris lumbricoides TaxID=6252 RepID=A0A0M3ISW3_ASCLU
LDIIEHPNASVSLLTQSAVSDFLRHVHVTQAPAANNIHKSSSHTTISVTSSTPSPKPKMGGSTMKTAKVWRYFDQLPTEEQAAECKICCKKIKATNSRFLFPRRNILSICSTTGMIRHLRSCHVNEYQLLQEARQTGFVIKQEEKTKGTMAKQFSDTRKQKPKEASAHTIANLIGTSSEVTSKSALTTSSMNHKSHNEAPISKRLKIDECKAVDLRVERTTQDKEGNRKLSTVRSNEKRQLTKDTCCWPEDHPDAKRITNQVGLMLLLDNESPAAVDRAGFRGLLRLLEPKYRMPSAEKFQKVIIPEIFNQLKADIVGFQQSFFQNNPFGVEAAASNGIHGASAANIIKSNVQEHSKPIAAHTEQVYISISVWYYQLIFIEYVGILIRFDGS